MNKNSIRPQSFFHLTRLNTFQFSTSLTEKEYVKHVENFLSDINDQLEEIMDTNNFIEDIEYGSGVLTIYLTNGKTYVLNKQAPNK